MKDRVNAGGGSSIGKGTDIGPDRVCIILTLLGHIWVSVNATKNNKDKDIYVLLLLPCSVNYGDDNNVPIQFS